MSKALEGARKKGLTAGKEGKPDTACPYADHRTCHGAVTFSRAFIRAWLEGWEEGQKETKPK